jgi:acetylornithine/succinyldiaminopimelate/putrescine aminotransferase
MLTTETHAAAVPALLPVYAQMPVHPVSGRGSWITDVDGQRWLDAYGGHAVSSTGHSHPDVVRAISEQAATLLFYSSLLPHPARQKLAEAIVARMPKGLDRVFFCNSGAEANDNALMLARKRTGRTLTVAVGGGWHGRTLACQAVTEGPKYEKNTKLAGMPLARRVPFDDVAALDAALRDDVAAMIVEPVQGMAGARDCSPAFLQAARRLCTERGIALLFDEVQCGVGRVGTFTAAELYGVTPDGMSLAKGLGSGLPIGVTIVGDFLAQGLVLGDLGSTFGGGPVPCAAALATLEVIDREGLLRNTQVVGERLRAGALTLPGVTRVQGRGLLLGLVLDRPAKDVQRALFEHRVLTGTSDDAHVLRLLPSLTFSVDEADQVLAALRTVLAG